MSPAGNPTTVRALTYATLKEQRMMPALRRLFIGMLLAFATSAVAAAFAAPAYAAAPVLALHMESPESMQPNETVEFKFVVENIGDAPTSGSVSFKNTFPVGVEVPPELYEGTANNCSTVGQTLSCELPMENKLPGAYVEVKFHAHVESGASPGTLSDEVEAEGGGAFEPVSRKETLYIGPPKPFGFRHFSTEITAEDGSAAVQAGSAPGSLTNDFDITSRSEPFGFGPSLTVTTEQFRTTVGRVPAGVIGNPNATPEKCTGAQIGLYAYGGGCPPDSQIGYVRLFNDEMTPLFNMVPGPGRPAQFAFSYAAVVSVLTAELRPDYGFNIVNEKAVDSLPLTSVDVTLWGVPAAASHDTLRSETCLFRQQNGNTCPTEAEPQAFLRLPTSCPSHPLTWEIESDSYLHPETWAHATNTTPAPVGCNQLEFTPTMEARPTTNVGDAPSGLEFHLHLPQNADPEGLAEANLKNTVLTLPPGMTINPSSANGLGSCTPSEIGLTTAVGETPVRFRQEPAHCPDASRLGSLEIDTPVVDHPLKGSVYLATPFENPYHSLIALYIAVNDPQTGTFVKLPARVVPDPSTGQIKAFAEETPQIPFEDFHLEFDQGPHAALRTPAACGKYTSESVLTPWTTPEGADAARSDSWQIIKGANGGSCSSSESQLPAKVSFSAGTVDPKGGAFTPFALKVTRTDGSIGMKSIDTVLPPGLIGSLAGVATCSDSQLAAAAAKSGRSEQESPSCPAASRVGGVNVGSGAGPSPFYAKGDAYLAGPYKGAPVSLAFVVPAVAGPFDLGTVVTRAALYVDPETTQLHAVSDPIPTILQGIPLDIRSIAVDLDRKNFSLNPTSCDPMAITGTVGMIFGQGLDVSNPFQVGGCQDLGFKPKLSFRLRGGTKRGENPQLRAVLKARPGDANISRTQVTLPHSEFLAQGHLHDICTRVQFAAQECPAKSIYGYAKAVTPLLDQPLQGPVYLRSSSNKLPDLVMALRGRIEVDLDAKIDTGKNDGLRSTFEVVPDAPVSEFVLSMKGGKKSLLENSTNICARKHTANVQMEAHNGKTADQAPVIQVAGCRKGKHHKHTAKHHR